VLTPPTPALQANKPVMGIVQDTLLGCRLITKRDSFIEKDVFYNILMWLENWDGRVPAPAILKPRPLWTGKQVFTLFIPDVNLRRTSAWHKDGEQDDFSPGDTQVLIEKGELLTGTLCKRTVGAGGGGLIHVIWEEHGPHAARSFLNQTQLLVNYWLLQHSFSVGIGDTIADEATMHSINATISKAKLDVKDLIKQAQDKRLEAQPGRTMQESFESKVNQVLNKARDEAGNSAQGSLPDTNNVLRMVTAGSKGSFINISQMIACVGQQNVEGKRIPYGFVDRTLPHFTKDDYGPESRGFVANSYLRGLTPQEFFFHAMGGREGLIDTAVKTSETGYIQRRLVKAMEDVMVKYDGTVRNSVGDVIQFLYGEDGMAAELIESQKLDSLRMNKRQFEEAYRIDEKDRRTADWLAPAWLEELENSAEKRDVLAGELAQLAKDREIVRQLIPTGDASIHLPVNMARIIWNAQKRFVGAGQRQKITDLSPVEVAESVRKLSSRLVVVPGDDELSVEAQRNATVLFNVLLRSKFAAKKVLKEHRLNAAAFHWVLGEVEERFKQAIAVPGEMIGTVAAQSIGEPATQMTLNTFHYAGVSAKNVTLGVPRLKEIINIAKKVKTPSLSVYLVPEVAKDRERAKAAQASLEYTTLHNVTHATEIYYDPDPVDTRIEEDREFVRSYYEMPDEEVDPARLSPWLLRIELNREMMVDKKLSMADVAERINSEFHNDLTCIFTDDNAEKLLLRIRIVNDEAGGKGAADDGASPEDDVFLKRIESSMLTQLKLRGITDIRKVFIRAASKPRFDEQEAYANENEWMLDTEGVNLLEVLNHPDVDHTRTQSNHLIETLEVLGIEAVRNALLKELRGVIEFDGSYVNYRHLAILCEVMTYRGHLMAITRHGINRVETGPLMRCSFEETVDILLEAAAFAERDSMRGVSENIMLGQFSNIGTGAFTLLLNELMLADAIEVAVHLSDMGEFPMGMTPGRSPGSMTPGGQSPSFLLSPHLSPFIAGGGAAFSPFNDSTFSPTRCALLGVAACAVA
jgi:DNA-directed RNA polymerase II subunit RPB1